MPWLKQVRACCDMLVPGRAGRQRRRGAAVRRRQPLGQAAGDLPEVDSRARCGRRGSTRASPEPTASRTRPTARGLLVGYRWYTAEAPHAAVPVRLRPVVHAFKYSRSRRCSATRARGDRNVRPSPTPAPGGRRGRAALRQRPAGRGEPPIQLKGYEKLWLLPGERQLVTLQLNRRSFAYWNTKANGWRVTPGCYTVRVGGSSAHLPLRDQVCRRDGG